MAGILSGLLSAFFMGTTSVMNRALKDVPASLIMFYNSFIGGLGIIVATAASGNEFTMLNYSGYQWIILSVASIAGTLALFAHTIAF